jgi:uncharacterized membrane protein YhiD involved in acid resistance
MNFLSNLNSAPIQQITSIEIVLNLVLAFVLGLLVAFVYRLTNRNKAINQSFMLTMVILAMVVALVMMVIGNSIARAFSLVGALSIIRFRTVVKDNRDIAYVFFSLAAGMSAGIGNYAVSIYGVGTICLLLLLLDFAQFGSSPKGVYLLRFQLIPTDTDDSSFLAILNKRLVSYTRLAVKTVRMGQFVEHSYIVRLKGGTNDQVLLSELSAIEGMDRVSLILDESEAGM